MREVWLSLKKSDFHRGTYMSTEWKLILEAQSSTRENTESLAAALITDCEINFSGDTFSIEIVESKAKDLRAMWNTRVRGLDCS